MQCTGPTVGYACLQVAVNAVPLAESGETSHLVTEDGPPVTIVTAK